MNKIPEEIELTEEFDSLEDIVHTVIQNSAEAQELNKDTLETIPITAIDEGVMPYAIKNDREISQESWNNMRERIRSAVSARGYTIS